MAPHAVPELAPGCFENSDKWPVLQAMPVRLAVRIPLPRMVLRDVRALAVGDVLESEWPCAEEVPLHAANVALSWCEFAVVDGFIAARLTRLG
jgi:flagellar motor switch protein FliM